jgi:type I restriction enzyme M protein
MAHLIDAQPYRTVYDPTCGSAGLLIKCRLLFEQRHPEQKDKAPHLFGQELNPVTFAMAKMNMFLHDYTDSTFQIGDTLTKPGFAAEGAGLRKFDYVVANPMWNQDNYDETLYENDQWKRFEYGAAPSSSADWGWLQHIAASLNDNGRAAVVLDTGAVSRGSGSKSSNKESLIRKGFVEADLVEGVVLLPENLFYNTTAPGIVLVLNRNKPAARKGQFLLVNASGYFVKEKPKNVLSVTGIAAVSDVFHRWKQREKLSRVVTLEEIRVTDYNISPSLFVETNDKYQHRIIGTILSDLLVAKAEREHADRVLDQMLEKLSFSTGKQRA